MQIAPYYSLSQTQNFEALSRKKGMTSERFATRNHSNKLANRQTRIARDLAILEIINEDHSPKYNSLLRSLKNTSTAKRKVDSQLPPKRSRKINKKA